MCDVYINAVNIKDHERIAEPAQRQSFLPSRKETAGGDSAAPWLGYPYFVTNMHRKRVRVHAEGALRGAD